MSTFDEVLLALGTWLALAFFVSLFVGAFIRRGGER